MVHVFAELSKTITFIFGLSSPPDIANNHPIPRLTCQCFVQYGFQFVVHNPWFPLENFLFAKPRPVSPRSGFPQEHDSSFPGAPWPVPSVNIKEFVLILEKENQINNFLPSKHNTVMECLAWTHQTLGKSPGLSVSECAQKMFSSSLSSTCFIVGALHILFGFTCEFRRFHFAIFFVTFWGRVLIAQIAELRMHTRTTKLWQRSFSLTYLSSLLTSCSFRNRVHFPSTHSGHTEKATDWHACVQFLLVGPFVFVVVEVLKR